MIIFNQYITILSHETHFFLTKSFFFLKNKKIESEISF